MRNKWFQNCPQIGVRLFFQPTTALFALPTAFFAPLFSLAHPYNFFFFFFFKTSLHFCGLSELPKTLVQRGLKKKSIFFPNFCSNLGSFVLFWQFCSILAVLCCTGTARIEQNCHFNFSQIFFSQNVSKCKESSQKCYNCFIVTVKHPKC